MIEQNPEIVCKTIETNWSHLVHDIKCEIDKDDPNKINCTIVPKVVLDSITVDIVVKRNSDD